jgi:uncharacterized phage-associated protein
VNICAKVESNRGDTVLPNYFFTGADARTVGNRFLGLAREDNSPVDPMKLQKLVYLGHGWHLVYFGSSLVRQPIEAWKYGPVIHDLYSEFKEFGANPISRDANNSDAPSWPPESDTLMQNVWNTYKKYDAIELSMLTHEPGGAWDRTIKTRMTSTIPNAWIAEEFFRRKQKG